MESNLTKGSIFGNIIRFSVPYMLSYFMQMLYGLADLYIVGRYDGTASITAVSIGSQIMHFVTVMLVGVAMGTTVTIGRAVGEGNSKRVSRTIGNTIIIFIVGSVALTGIMLALTDSVVRVMSTPAEAVSETRSYLLICFGGIPFITAYNIISSIYRGLGDSSSPMYFVAVACVANIGLDFLFIGAMDMGAAGAALGTTLAQTVSVVVALLSVKCKKGSISLDRSDLRPDRDIIGNILRVGFPVALQDGFIQVAFLIVTIIANRRGLLDAAAVGIVEKIIGLVFIIPSSMLSSVSAIVSQNLGAGKEKRATDSLRYAVFICVGFGLVVSVAVQFCAGGIVGIFEDDSRVVELGSQYLRSYIWDCLLAGIHFCFSGYFCACQHSGISFLHNSLSIVLARVPLAYLLSRMYDDTLFPMGAAAPIGSLLSVIICVIAYIILRRRAKHITP
ncbi:MAG: MATE family efflux transporter [Eubacteriales bacterium]|nr:MATE family efflux transporter [Eubacteriales bacterium]